MTHILGRNSNQNSDAVISADIALNSSTSTTLIVANDERISVEIQNLGDDLVRIKLQAASIDDDVKGFVLRLGESYWPAADNMFVGEISAISESGTPSVTVTEY